MDTNTMLTNVTGDDEELDVYFNVYYYGLFFMLTLINIPGNIIVIITMLRHRQLRQPGNYFLVSLACSDLLMGCLYPIYNISHLEISNVSGPLGQWPVCWTVLVSVLLSETGSSFHIVSITITRYIAIVYPLKYRIILTKKCGLTGVAVTWLLAVVVTLVLYWPEKPDTYKGMCRYEKIFEPSKVWAFSGVQFIVPLIITTGLYIRLMKSVRQHTREMAAENATSIRGNVHSVNARKSFIMVTILVGWFTFSYIPMCVYLVIAMLCTGCNVNKYIRASIRILMYTNYMVNIFIYAGRHGDFRSCLRNDLRQSCMRHSNYIKNRSNSLPVCKISQQTEELATFHRSISDCAMD